MLMMYLFLFLTAWVLLEIISRILHVVYLVRISMLVDSIGNKQDLLFLSLQDYEYVIAEVFRRSGYKVRMSKKFADGGNGIILNDLHYVVARKEAYHHLIEVEQARKLTKHMQDNEIYRGMIITLGDFKPSTRNYCHINVITCIDGNQLLQMLKKVQSLNPISIKFP
ncbi:MAG: restriction endonuclease [Ruminiclostridium sp.]|nr:restriction endonuclease [Ruminiclostridium sp.]